MVAEFGLVVCRGAHPWALPNAKYTINVVMNLNILSSQDLGEGWFLNFVLKSQRDLTLTSRHSFPPTLKSSCKIPPRKGYSWIMCSPHTLQALYIRCRCFVTWEGNWSDKELCRWVSKKLVSELRHFESTHFVFYSLWCEVGSGAKVYFSLGRPQLASIPSIESSLHR